MASLTCTVKLKVPKAVGVPERVPAEESVKPAGKAPVRRLKLYGAMPPLPVKVWLYGVPSEPFGSIEGAMPIVGQVIWIVYARPPVQLLASPAWMVKLNVPVTVGVPESAPADDSVIPAGKAPALIVKL